MTSNPKKEIKANGLSSSQASDLLSKYGPNEIKDKKTSFLKKTIKWLTSPISLLLIAAAALSFYMGKEFDGWFIIGLFLTNFVVARWHESKADKAIDVLRKKLTINIKTKRDGDWKSISSTKLVPGDVVQLNVGSLVPADMLIIETKNLNVNESVLTGESLPQEKKEGEIIYTGSFITTGMLIGQVAATGNKTKFGKTVSMIDTKSKTSVLDKDILTITKYLMILSVSAAAIITTYLLIVGHSISDLLRLDLSILVAGVPVAMPTVMSLIISLGVLRLTKKQVIVRRLSSLEDLANVNLLLSDKTGTLTKNEVLVENIITYDNETSEEVMRYAVSAISDNKLDPINLGVIKKAEDLKQTAYTQEDFIPADSERKRSTATVKVKGKSLTISLGAAQVVEKLCDMNKTTKDRFHKDIETAADGGYRSLAVAVVGGKSEKSLRLVGLILLSDTLRSDAKQVVNFLENTGISVKMMTGDNKSISERIATQLGLRGDIHASRDHNAAITISKVNDISVFSEVLPVDKLNIVKAAATQYTVAATGDGVNDLPALKLASVGIAVKNSVDALKSAADIVLMTNGIGVIRDAIIEARKIFMRTYYYSVYRISESSRLIVSIAILSVLYGNLPITAIQILLLAVLNDLPIISLAYDNVEPSNKPATIDVKRRFQLTAIFGLVGVATSVIFFLLLQNVFGLNTDSIQTMFFLKLAVSGHMLIYVAHTKKLWWKHLPSKQVIWATSLTQLIATAIAISGVFFQGITVWQALLTWGWALGWMQVSELSKQLFYRFSKD